MFVANAETEFGIAKTKIRKKRFFINCGPRIGIHSIAIQP